MRNGQHAELLRLSTAIERHFNYLAQLFWVPMHRKAKPSVYNSFHEHILRAYAAALDHVGDIQAEEGVFLQLMELYPDGQYLGDYVAYLHRRKRTLSRRR